MTQVLELAKIATMNLLDNLVKRWTKWLNRKGILAEKWNPKKGQNENSRTEKYSISNKEFIRWA